MSGGEQQMLAVARALARDLKILFLDEPYEGLAPVIVHEIERIVSKSATSASPRSSSSRTPWRHCVSPTRRDHGHRRSRVQRHGQGSAGE